MRRWRRPLPAVAPRPLPLPERHDIELGHATRAARNRDTDTDARDTALRSPVAIMTNSQGVGCFKSALRVELRVLGGVTFRVRLE